MNNLKEYIIEKLTINKDIKLSNSNLYELVGGILFNCGWNFRLGDSEEFVQKKEKEDEPLVNGIIKWVKTYDVMDVKPYADYNNLRDWYESESVIEMFIDDEEKVNNYVDDFVYRRNFLVKVDGNDKSTQYEIYYDDKALLYRESDNGDFWANRLFIKDK